MYQTIWAERYAFDYKNKDTNYFGQIGLNTF